MILMPLVFTKKSRFLVISFEPFYEFCHVNNREHFFTYWTRTRMLVVRATS